MEIASSYILSEYTKLSANPMAINGDIDQILVLPFFPEHVLMKLIDEANVHFTSQPVLIDVPDDVYVIGDLHGNIRDLIRILKQTFFLNSTSSRVLFLGDYVDRGEFSLEVITLLLAIILQFPDRVFMIRGNHEFRNVNEKYGFKDEIMLQYESEALWNAFNDKVFDYMPIAALINTKILCVHGGISPNMSIKVLREVKRPLTSYEGSEMLTSLMWSDPESSFSMYHESDRGCGYKFGGRAVKAFLQENNLEKIYRAHQYQPKGIKIMFQNRLITVFSCSNYCNVLNNSLSFLYSLNCEEKYFELQPLPLLKRKDAVYRNIFVNKTVSNPILSLNLQKMPTQLKALNQKSSRKPVCCRSRIIKQQLTPKRSSLISLTQHINL